MEKLRPHSPNLAKTITLIVYILLYLPLVGIVVSSFYSPSEGWGTLNWYYLLLKDEELLKSLLRSLEVSLISSSMTTILGLGAALALYQSSYPVVLFLKRLIDQALILPEIIFALSLLSWLSLIHFPLGFFSIIIAHVTFTLSFFVILMLTRLQALDPKLEEAAIDLGATPQQVIYSIVLPQLTPAILTGFLLSFLLSFDDFLITYFIGGAGSDTLPVRLYTRAKVGYSPTVNAISTLLLVLSTFLSLVLLKLNKRPKKRFF